MRSESDTDRHAITFGFGVVSGTLLIATAAGYAARTYPDAVSRSGGAQIALFCFALLAYLACGWWARSSRDVEVEASLGIGAAVGILLGVVGAVNITVEDFVTLPGPLRAIVPATSMALMVIAFALAATLAIRRSRSIALALLASVWSSVVGMVLTCAYGFLLNLAAIESLSRTFAAAAARAGVRDAHSSVGFASSKSGGCGEHGLTFVRWPGPEGLRRFASFPASDMLTRRILNEGGFHGRSKTCRLISCASRCEYV